MELGNMLQQLAGGMLITTEIFVLTLLFSLPLGLFLSFGRISKIGVLRFITKIYISVMRGTPLMLQLIVVYFAPYYVFGMKISKGYRMVAVILAFVLTVTEMFTIAKQIAAAQASVAPLMAAGVFYYIFNLVVAMVMEHVEKRLNYYRG